MSDMKVGRIAFGPPVGEPNKVELSKSGLSSGIRPANGIQQFIDRLEKLERTVRESLNETNQWNMLLREWRNKSIHIELVTKKSEIGELLWADRYTVCIRGATGKQTIVHKGAIATICLAST